MSVDLQRAQEFLDALREEYPVCLRCLKYTDASVAAGEVVPGEFPEWDRDTFSGIVVRRCATCLKPRRWAKSVTVEQVRDWFLANPPEPGVMVDVEKMRRDLASSGGGFKLL